MSLHRTVSALLSIGFALAGCKDKPAPQGATVAPDPPPPKASVTAVVEPAPSAIAPAPEPAAARGPRFVVRRRATKESMFYWLGSGVVVCDNSICAGDAYMITEKGLVDTYDPRGAITLQKPEALKDWPVVKFYYDGEYPDVCVTIGYFNDRTDSTGPTFKRTGKTWTESRVGCAATPNPAEQDPDAPIEGEEKPIPRPPRDLDDALLHAPIADAAKTIVRGAGAPPMLIAEKALYLWDGKAWSKRDAPWKKIKETLETNRVFLSKRPVRLMNGATLVIEGGYLVDAKGEINALNLVEDDKPISSTAEVFGVNWTKKFPWLLAAEGKDVYLTSPDTAEKTSFIPATVPGRTPAVKVPSAAPTVTAAPDAAASAAPSAAAVAEPNPSASAASSAATPVTPDAPSNGLTAPKPYTTACTTPFVLLASPPKPGQAYATTREGLRGHGELQDIVTFVEFVVEGKTYFGVQARTEADARQFMEVVEKSIKGMKPQLLCLDVLSLVPDRYAPPAGIRIVGINLTTGELVPFD